MFGGACRVSLLSGFATRKNSDDFTSMPDALARKCSTRRSAFVSFKPISVPGRLSPWEPKPRPIFVVATMLEPTTGRCRAAVAVQRQETRTGATPGRRVARKLPSGIDSA